MFPSLTLIVLNYNGLHHLQACFPSLVNADYPADCLNLMLVDNASSDGSVSYMGQHFPQVQIVSNDRNLGFAAGNNRGARLAQSQYVVFLNNDMRIEPQFLRELVKVAQSEPGVICVGAKILNWDGSRVDFGGAAADFAAHAYQLGWNQPLQAGQYVEVEQILFPCGGGMLIDRKAFLEAGGFDESYYLFYEDFDLGWRLWLLGHRILFAPGAIAYHQHHGSVSTLPELRKAVFYKRNAFSSILKNYSDENVGAALSAALLASLSGLAQQTLEGSRSAGLTVEEQNAATLAAIHEVVQNLPELMEKRRFIQQNRRRSDEELAALFHWPFRYWPETNLRTQYPIAAALGVQRLFRHLPRRVLVVAREEQISARLENLGQGLRECGHIVLFAPFDRARQAEEAGTFSWDEKTLLPAVLAADPDILIAADWQSAGLLWERGVDYPLIVDQPSPIPEADFFHALGVLGRADLLTCADEGQRAALLAWLERAGWSEEERFAHVRVIGDPLASLEIAALDDFIRAPRLRPRSRWVEGQFAEVILGRLQEKDHSLHSLSNELRKVAVRYDNDAAAWQTQLQNVETTLRTAEDELRSVKEALRVAQDQQEKTLISMESANRALDETNRYLTEITASRAWQLIVAFRRLRLKIIPRGSWLERVLHLQPQA